MWRRSPSSAASRPGWSRTTSRPASTRPDLYDPKINRSYAELAAHYGTLVDPARAAKPKDKPQVERPMPYVRDSFWRGREFTSLDRDARRRAALEPRGRRDAGVSPAGRRGPGGGVRRGRGSRRCGRCRRRRSCSRPGRRARVGPDIHAKVGGTLYSLPWRFLGDRVDARTTPSMVQFFHHGQLIKTHPRKDRGKQTDLGDYPPEKIAFHMRTPTWCRRRAAEIGPATVAVIDGLLAENALFRLRAAQGVLGLADRHDPARLEAACATATAAGDPSYRTIKGILAAGTETAPAARPTGDGGAPAHLHGPRAALRRPDRRRHRRCPSAARRPRGRGRHVNPTARHRPARHRADAGSEHRPARTPARRAPPARSRIAEIAEFLAAAAHPVPAERPAVPPRRHAPPSGPRSWPARPTCSPGSPPQHPDLTSADRRRPPTRRARPTEAAA